MSGVFELPEGFNVTPIQPNQPEPSMELPEGFTVNPVQPTSSQLPEGFTLTPTQPLDVNTLEKGTYTEDDLVGEKYYGTVSEYMKNCLLYTSPSPRD